MSDDLTAQEHLLQGLMLLILEKKTWTRVERDRWWELLVRIIDYTIEVIPEQDKEEERGAYVSGG